ncbi:unnamed protein product, partial [Porites lobata]
GCNSGEITEFLKEQLEASVAVRSLIVVMYAERHTIVPVMFYKAAKLTLSDEMSVSELSMLNSSSSSGSVSLLELLWSSGVKLAFSLSSQSLLSKTRILASDDELNELVLRVMLGNVWGFNVLGAMDEKRLELIVDRFVYADCHKHNVGDNGSKEQ